MHNSSYSVDLTNSKVQEGKNKSILNSGGAFVTYHSGLKCINGNNYIVTFRPTKTEMLETITIYYPKHVYSSYFNINSSIHSDYFASSENLSGEYRKYKDGNISSREFMNVKGENISVYLDNLCKINYSPNNSYDYFNHSFTKEEIFQIETYQGELSLISEIIYNDVNSIFGEIKKIKQAIKDYCEWKNQKN